MPRSGEAAGISPTPASVRAKLPLSGVCSCAREMNRESNRLQLLSWSDITLQLGRERLIRVIREQCQSPVSVASQAWLRSRELQNNKGSCRQAAISSSAAVAAKSSGMPLSKYLSPAQHRVSSGDKDHCFP